MKDKEIQPALRVNMAHRCMYINYAVYNILGSPPYYDFLWNDEKRILAVKPIFCAKDGSFKLPDWIGTKTKNEICLPETTFFGRLKNELAWKDNETYKFYGVFYPDMSIVAFDMSRPVIIKTVVK